MADAQAFVAGALQVEDHPSVALEREPAKEHTLPDCLQAYTAAETLGPDNKWDCPKCKTAVQARTKLDLWSLPEVLVVHLKRFIQSSMQPSICTKIGDIVDFPLEGLEMRQYLHPAATQTGDLVYDCFAFSCHMGTFSGGHYTAYARSPVPSSMSDSCTEAAAEAPSDPRLHKWYLFNDSDVRNVRADDLDKQAGYLLFYRRRTEALADPPDLLAKCREEESERLDAERDHDLAAAPCVTPAAPASCEDMPGLEEPSSPMWSHADGTQPLRVPSACDHMDLDIADVPDADSPPPRSAATSGSGRGGERGGCVYSGAPSPDPAPPPPSWIDAQADWPSPPEGGGAAETTEERLARELRMRRLKTTKGDVDAQADNKVDMVRSGSSNGNDSISIVSGPCSVPPRALDDIGLTAQSTRELPQSERMQP